MPLIETQSSFLSIISQCPFFDEPTNFISSLFLIARVIVALDFESFSANSSRVIEGFFLISVLIKSTIVILGVILGVMSTYWIQTIQSNHEIALADIELRLKFCALMNLKIISPFKIALINYQFFNVHLSCLFSL